MKTKFILFFLLFAGVVSAQIKRVAVLETVDKEGRVKYADEMMLRDNLMKAITNTPGYEAYSRTEIDAIMAEHSFQRTGLVSDEQIKQLGEMTGANYILVAEAAVSDAQRLFVSVKLLDVVTARTIIAETMTILTQNMEKGCAKLAKMMFPDGRKVNTYQQNFSSLGGPLLVKNKKIDQKLLGLGKYSCENVQMDQKALDGFLRNNSYETYKRYLRAQSCVKAGWALFGIGAITTMTGVALFGLSEVYEKKRKEIKSAIMEEYNRDIDYEYGTFSPQDERGKYLKTAYGFYLKRDLLLYFELAPALVGAGGGLVCISVPLLSTGYSIKNNIHKYYNENANTKPVFTLNLQYNQNGLGLALTF